MARLHHIAVLCVNPVLVAGFYQQAFDLKENRIHRHDDGRVRSVWLNDEHGTLYMFEFATAALTTAAGVSRDGRPGFHLLAFVVTEAEREAMVRKFHTLGASEESRTAFTSYFRDPEGNRVALSHYPA